MIARAAHPSHFPWLTSRLGLDITPSFRAVEVVDRSGVIQGMVGFDGWTPNAVQMHVALDTPLAGRAIIRPAFVYPFVQADRGVVLVSVASTNGKSLSLVRGLGFREVYRVRDGVRVGVDALLFEMRRAECRWIRTNMRKAA